MSKDAKMDKFAKMYERVSELKDLKHAEKQVLSRIYGWPEGCWERNGELGKLLDLHPRTVQKAVRVLREKGYIEVEYRRTKNIRIMTVSLKKVNEIEIPLFAKKAAVKGLVNNLAEKMSGAASGHRGIAHRPRGHSPQGTHIDNKREKRY